MPRKLSDLHIPDEITPEIALAIVVRQRRQELNLSQEQLGEVDLGQALISRVENGEREIGMRTLIRLAAILQMTAGELMDAVTARMKHG